MSENRFPVPMHMPAELVQIIQQYACDDAGLVNSVNFLSRIVRDQHDDRPDFTPKQVLAMSLALDGKNIWIHVSENWVGFTAFVDHLRQLFCDAADLESDDVRFLDEESSCYPDRPFELTTLIIDATWMQHSRLARLEQYLSCPLKYFTRVDRKKVHVQEIPSDAELSEREEQPFGGVQIICLNTIAMPVHRAFDSFHVVTLA